MLAAIRGVASEGRRAADFVCREADAPKDAARMLEEELVPHRAPLEVLARAPEEAAAVVEAKGHGRGPAFPGGDLADGTRPARMAWSRSTACGN